MPTHDPKLLERCALAQRAAEALLQALLDALRRTLAEGSADTALQRDQAHAHGVAWAATYVHALQQLLDWAVRLHNAGRLGTLPMPSVWRNWPAGCR